MELVTLSLMMVSLLGAIILKLATTELQDWLPTIARRIIDRAVMRLPDEIRERYREEWYAHMDDCPGRVSKLWHAIG